MNTVHYTNCPVCESNDIKNLMQVKDHSVSGKEFGIWQCFNCRLRFTQDVPGEDTIGPYYQSEDYISHTNTGKGFINQVYQKVRKFTLHQKAKLIISYTKKKGSILDLGAGVGAFLSTMKEKGWEVTGVEPDAGARLRAKEDFNMELLDKDSFWQLKNGSFDAISLWHVLEHVHELHAYIEKIGKLLKPGGKLFIAVPNYTSAESTVYNAYWAAYDVPRHLYHFAPETIDVLVQKHGMQIIAEKPMWFDSFYISLLSSKYRKGKANWIEAGYNGLRSNLTALFNRKKCSSLIYVIEKY